MRIRFTCRNADCQAVNELPAGETVTCPQCGSQLELTRTGEEENIEQCLVCDSDELYVRKDFPQRLGLIVVVTVAVISFYLFYKGELLWSLGILIATVLVDLVIYAAVPKITVCYRCRAEYRQCRINPQHHGFDLATAEKYR
jgi:hypothetical protein